MSVRNLGDWSPLDLDSDPVYTDPDRIDEAQKRYQKISDTIEDAIAKLGKIVDQGSDTLAGQYVETLKSDASSVKDSLTKASRRYADVADQIKKYQPHLDDGLRDTATALSDARDAKDAQTKANAMPDGQANSDGTLPPDEQQKRDARNKAIGAAGDQLSAAKNLLNNAMNALNTAGKAFGDAVNCNNYDDGLTDSLKDKIDAVFEKIGQIFAIIGMILGVLAILIPGVDLLAIGALAAGVVSLISSSVLYANGDGSLLDVVLGAVGLGLGGLGMAFSALSRDIAGVAKAVMKLGPWREQPPRLEFTDHWNGDDIELGDFTTGPGARPGNPSVNPVPANDPTPGDWVTLPKNFWDAQTAGLGNAWQMWKQLGDGWSGVKQFFIDLGQSTIGWKGAADFSALMQEAGRTISPAWFAWGFGNGIFNLGVLVVTGGELKTWFPAVNPPGYGS